MQPNRKIGEKQDEMGRLLGKDGCRQTNKESKGGKTSTSQEKGKATAEMGGLHDEGYEKIGGGWKMERDSRWKTMERKNRQSGSTNTLPDPYPCTAGNKVEEHTTILDYMLIRKPIFQL